MKQKTYTQLFIIYLPYLIGFTFIFASLIKIQGLRFTAESGIENPINSAWLFFETLYKSVLYWRFNGIAKFITGTLLVMQRLPICRSNFVLTNYS